MYDSHNQKTNSNCVDNMTKSSGTDQAKGKGHGNIICCLSKQAGGHLKFFVILRRPDQSFHVVKTLLIVFPT